MYIETLGIENYRSFPFEKVNFLHPPLEGAGKPWANINLLLGPNGSGKTTLLRAAAIGLMAALMPRFNPRYLIRREGKEQTSDKAQIDLEVRLHEQDGVDLSPGSVLNYRAHIRADRGIYSGATVSGGRVGEQTFEEIYKEEAPSFFMLGYGATRWVPVAGQYDIPKARDQRNHPRYQRVASLFEENFGLMPLDAWIPATRFQNPSLVPKAADLIKALLPSDMPDVTLLEPEDILFEDVDNVSLPLEALSDGYRSYLAWVCDLAYHLAVCCPKEMPFEDLPGVVLIDEIDLYLHPAWQQHVLKKISETLPKLQFILTSHSPLVAGTLPAENIHIMTRDEKGYPKAARLDREIRGLDADQVLTSVFGLESSRTPEFDDQKHRLYRKAAAGDREAALQVLGLHAHGLDAAERD
ncbi:MAG: AAA family ATPase [Acidobacteriota bacterium]|nr:AAA family ATPase [Acidobacteriota bacterium]